MNQRIKQSGKTAQINSMAEQIFLRMCTTAQHGFDASHYVRRSYELAKAFYQNIDKVKTSSDSGEKK
ncbi:hypothetical protein V144x_01730 [Gimesia aquarii]|nr:hypothetical protein V144x_01730 [Gimesia aquarii]